MVKLRIDNNNNLAKSERNKKKINGPILFLRFEESLVSSNLSSKLLWFHSVRPNVKTDS